MAAVVGEVEAEGDDNELWRSMGIAMRYSTFRNVSIVSLCVSLIAIFGFQHVVAQDRGPKVFSTPDTAIKALVKAVRTKKTGPIVAILGNETSEWLSSGDSVQDRLGMEAFINAFDKKNVIEMEGDDKAHLIIGDDDFPFPFPVVKTSAGWVFDAEQGHEELINRRVGRNELTTMKVLLAIRDAQFEYASEDHNGDGLLEYASKFRSSPGKKDGLYWPTSDGEALSPLGPLVAEAVKSGYSLKKNDNKDEVSNPFHGYHFKMLSRQGPDAIGGAYEYMVDGKMIGGFAVVAYPARYDNSGIMTFMINHDGTVFESDLGEETAPLVRAMEVFNPDQNWKKADTE